MHLWEHRLALFGQLQGNPPPVVVAAVAADQTLALETTDHSRHGSSVVGHCPTEIGGRGRSAQRQQRNDRRLRATHPKMRKTLVRGQLAVSSGQHLRS